MGELTEQRIAAAAERTAEVRRLIDFMSDPALAATYISYAQYLMVRGWIDEAEAQHAADQGALKEMAADRDALQNEFNALNEGGLKRIAELEAEIKRLREAREARPLTLEELRGMDGEPVVVVRKEGPHKEIFGATIDVQNQQCSAVRKKWTICWFEFSDYGKAWIAYHSKPNEATP